MGNEHMFPPVSMTCVWRCRALSLEYCFLSAEMSRLGRLGIENSCCGSAEGRGCCPCEDLLKVVSVEPAIYDKVIA